MTKHHRCHKCLKACDIDKGGKNPPLKKSEDSMVEKKEKCNCRIYTNGIVIHEDHCGEVTEMNKTAEDSHDMVEGETIDLLKGLVCDCKQKVCPRRQALVEGVDSIAEKAVENERKRLLEGIKQMEKEKWNYTWVKALITNKTS
ncbi:MAG TPA: hypothetical protein ENI23_06625 [bacterium]|nr:hypothetical protein [bacterium]